MRRCFERMYVLVVVILGCEVREVFREEVFREDVCVGGCGTFDIIQYHRNTVHRKIFLNRQDKLGSVPMCQHIPTATTTTTTTICTTTGATSGSYSTSW